MNEKRTLIWGTMLLIALFGLVASGCGPSTADLNEAGETGNEAAQQEAAVGETAEPVEQPAAAASVRPEAAGQPGETLSGLPAGFTVDGRPYIGQLDAPVVIEEFSDYQCPFCARFVRDTMPALMEEAIAGGEAVLIFYDFPLQIHAQAPAAANAARCAGEQSPAAYWAMHDELFETINRWSISDPAPIFVELAGDLGVDLDVDAFENCVRDGRYDDLVEADLEIGISRGVTGTPTFFLNDEPLVGAQPLSVFRDAIATVGRGESIAAEPELPSLDELDIPPFTMPDPLVPADDYAGELGDENAPILIVEYTDYQCPFCARHQAQTMPTLLAEMIETGRVRYALKDFPLDSIHPLARATAAAARCAGEQDAYWPMHDLIFERQAGWSGSSEIDQTLGEYAAELELDEEAFASCLASGRYDEVIQANLEEGLSFGITGTPAFVIGGYLVSGAQPFDVFELVVGNLEEGTIEQLFRESYDAQVEAYRQRIAQERAQQPAAPRPVEPVDVPIDGAIFVGDPEAPVVIVEYTDFQCPFCSRHVEETWPQIKENYIDTGLVRYVFKDFPLNFHEQAQKAAESARCANEQDAFMGMHELLFDRQDEWAGRSDAETVFIALAGELGLDEASFTACLESNRYAEAVQADLAEGSSFGVTGTPSFFINGQPLVGALPYQVFVQAIEAQLEEAGE